MRPFIATVCATVIALAFTPECAEVNKLDPTIPSTATPGQPCGPIDVVCYNASGKPDGCCNEYDTCGGGFPSVGCPADSCCYVGSDATMAAHRKPYLKRAPSGV